MAEGPKDTDLLDHSRLTLPTWLREKVACGVRRGFFLSDARGMCP